LNTPPPAHYSFAAPRDLKGWTTIRDKDGLRFERQYDECYNHGVPSSPAGCLVVVSGDRVKVYERYSGRLLYLDDVSKYQRLPQQHRP
jgi:hypothetical protein